MRLENPFHEGELQVQARAGELEQGQRNGQVVADSILKGALKFIAQQPMAVLASIDQQANVWASVLFGRQGFIQAPDERTVQFDLSQAVINDHDPFWTNIDDNATVGALIIELETRRRLRINGQIERPSDDRLTLQVAESYPNCPKYIQRRHVQFETGQLVAAPMQPIDGVALGREQAALITAADTFFVASTRTGADADVSHRGGPAGFVKVLDGQTIRIPEYRGNSMFNTLGNFATNPRAGLVFLDFDRGQTLQLIGGSEVLWDQQDDLNETGGTKRFWHLHIERWRQTPLPAGLRWQFLDASPHNPN